MRGRVTRQVPGAPWQGKKPVTDDSKHDSWVSGDSYDSYIGRWSRKIAPLFLDWVDAGPAMRWLDVGSGTGALSETIVERCDPGDLVGVEPSEGFRETARKAVSDPRARFEAGDAEAIPLADGSRDYVVSGLVLNFVPNREKAIGEMRRVAGGGGTVAFYVWDYPGGGLGLLRAFWQAATALDPAAESLTESKRFGFCDSDGLKALAVSGGLEEVRGTAIEVPTLFRNFEDYWRPFTLGAGPAPGYYASLGEQDREALRARLEGSLPRGGDGSIALTARVWAISGRAP